MKSFEKYMAIAFLIVFATIAVNMTINHTVPSKFYCEDKLIAEQLTPVDFQTMFSSCMSKCKSGDLECINVCVKIIDLGLNQTGGMD